MLMTAKEAKSATQETIHDKSMKMLQRIEERINDAIKDGEFYIEGCCDLPYDVAKKLKELGYKTKTGIKNNTRYYRVSWK